MVVSSLLPAQEPLTERPSAEPEEDMKKIPTTFELDEDDIREAITEWLNEHHGDSDWSDFTISFETEEKQSPGRGLPGGMNDPIITTVISAVAVKSE